MCSFVLRKLKSIKCNAMQRKREGKQMRNKKLEFKHLFLFFYIYLFSIKVIPFNKSINAKKKQLMIKASLTCMYTNCIVLVWISHLIKSYLLKCQRCKECRKKKFHMPYAGFKNSMCFGSPQRVIICIYDTPH